MSDKDDERRDKKDKADKKDKREKTQVRIERALARLADQQAEIGRRLGRLESKLGVEGSDAPSTSEVCRFLDEFRAGEALGEASLGAWIAVSQSECLRGGLRTVQMREAAHARLLEERLKELGGTLEFQIPDAVHERTMREAGDPDRSDAEKVLAFVKRFTDIDAAVHPIHALADRLDADPETQSLLRTIAQDERATLEFTHEACALLNPA